MDNFGFLLVYVVGILGLFYIWGPLNVFFLNMGPLNREFIARDPSEWLENADLEAKQIDDELRILGFFPSIAAAMPGSTGSISFLAYSSDISPSSAVIMVGTSPLGTRYIVEFCQIFETGSLLSLTNANTPRIFPRMSGRAIFRLPGVRNLAEQFSRFQRLCARSGFGLPVRLERGKELLRIKSLAELETAELVKRGLYSPNPSENSRRLTLYGAFYMSLRLMWPWKGILLSREAARTLSASEA
jgi:hypothetical protein